MNNEYSRPPVRIALIGLGRAMFADHYAVIKEHPDWFKVVAACDIVKERRDIIAKDFPECRMFRRVEDLLEEREIDLVDIATCSTDHVAHALSSLSHGFWTLIESPMALTYEDAQMLRGAATKAKNRLLVMHRGLFSADFLLAQQELTDVRLGEIYQVIIRKEDYVRRDDWQTVKRLGGGAAYYEMPDLFLQAFKLMPMPPVQMWSDLKRVASLGDAEDFVHVGLKTRTRISVELEYNGGVLPADRMWSFMIRGERGCFKVMPDAREGVLSVVEPRYKFPRRRSSVRTPGLADLHEDFPTVQLPIRLPEEQLCGVTGFWKQIYDTIRTAAVYPVSMDEEIETIRLAHLMKKVSPFGK
jgi:scyllo-inositol 2-dehydrogenase (NADP+)